MGRDTALELKENWIENIDTAYEIWARNGNWGAWEASRDCWGN